MFYCTTNIKKPKLLTIQQCYQLGLSTKQFYSTRKNRWKNHIFVQRGVSFSLDFLPNRQTEGRTSWEKPIFILLRKNKMFRNQKIKAVLPSSYLFAPSLTCFLFKNNGDDGKFIHGMFHPLQCYNHNAGPLLGKMPLPEIANIQVLSVRCQHTPRWDYKKGHCLGNPQFPHQQLLCFEGFLCSVVLSLLTKNEYIFRGSHLNFNN